MPWSKIRICVRSRIPKMWPSTVTRSPARSLRMSSSEAGNVSLCSAIYASRSNSTDPSAAMCAEARRAAQHW